VTIDRVFADFSASDLNVDSDDGFDVPERDRFDAFVP
jgi:hypothetical protein